MSINFNHVTNDISASSGSVTINGSVPGSGGGSSTLTLSNKTGAYTVVAGDNGTIINCSGATSFTVALTAAATLGAGFNCWIWNNTTTAAMAVTIDPNSTETIDGASTIILQRGEGVQIVCDGTNWQTGDKKALRGYADNLATNDTRSVASGAGSLALAGGTASNSYAFAAQTSALASGTYSVALGINTFATQTYALALGGGATATSQYSTAIGNKSGGGAAQTATGAGAMALGGSYASGTDSFAAAVANNTSSYGATGTNSVSFGYLAKASGASSFAVSTGAGATASGSSSIALGGRNYGITASGAGSTAIGDNTTASGDYSFAFGYRATSAIYGKFAYASGYFAAVGDAQTGSIVLRNSTTDATATVLTSTGGAASTTNQVILPNNSAYAFRCLVVGRRSVAQADEARAYEFSGLIRRGANATSTTLVAAITPTLIAGDATTSTWGGVSVTADTTNGGLSITVTGEAAKNIRWVATVWTSEVTYA